MSDSETVDGTIDQTLTTLKQASEARQFLLAKVDLDTLQRTKKVCIPVFYLMLELRY